MPVNNENLPATLNPEFPFKAIETASNPNITPMQVLSMNLALDAFAFSQIARAWSKANSITEIGQCLAFQFTAIEKHRNHLGMPNAYQDTSKKTSLVYPLD